MMSLARPPEDDSPVVTAEEAALLEAYIIDDPQMEKAQ